MAEQEKAREEEEVIANKGGRPLKTPKGMRDFTPLQVKIREEVIAQIKSCFQRHGAITIDTPVLELTEVLQGNYGEGNKEIYNISKDHDYEDGKENLSLRYDLTVPFARYIASKGIDKIKRYHIAKVYRKDTPRMTKGRYREFFQCDYDIAGVYDPMIPDAECLKLLTEILEEIGIGGYLVKVNHRKLLDGIFEVAEVPDQLFNTIASTVDKLDKISWEDAAAEMATKGLSKASVSKIGEFVQIKGHPDVVLPQLVSLQWPSSSPSIKALAEMELLFNYLKHFKILDRISFDLSMVRGLSYYTGMILEAVLIQGGTDVGSIAGGGRYDNLVDAFTPSQGIPAVGFSVGIERLFSIMEERWKGKRDNDTEVMVVSIGQNLLVDRFDIVTDLWRSNINAEFQYFLNPHLRSQLDYANKKGIPFVVLFGENEKQKGVLKIKNMADSSEETVARDQVVVRLKALLKK